MTTSSSKRSRRTSADEGPTIYKCEQLLRMLEKASLNRSKRHATTDLVKFLGGYLPVRTEANGAKSRREEDENPSSARFHSFCKQLAEALGVGKDFVLERITQGLLKDEVQLKALCDHLTAASEHYGSAMSLLKDEPVNRPVTIRIGTTNLINMRVLPTVLEGVRQSFRKKFPNTQLRFTQTILDSDELLFGSQPLVGVDVIVACCLDDRIGKISASELAARLPLECCLLRKRTEDSSEPVGSRCLSSWSELAGGDMVALTSRRKHFDVPWSEIESSMESIEEVPTLLEAHARVAASDAWTLSYRELMDDVDEQRLEVLGLPPDPQRRTPWIVALIPRKAQSSIDSDRSADNAKQCVLKLLKSQLQSAFERKQEIKREAEEMTRWLARFPYRYHISDYVPKGGTEIRRSWFAGRANLAFTPNGNLLGVFTLGNPTVKSLKVRVFGRPVPHHNRTVWHLQLRSVDQKAESGTTNLVVTKSDLKEGHVLVGSWIGRSSWMAEDVRPAGGPFILHTQAGLTAHELRQEVLAHQKQCVPDLRELSDEVVAMDVDRERLPTTATVRGRPKVTRKPRPKKPR